MQGEAYTPYDVKESGSKKFTAPLLDTPKSVQVIPQEVIQNQAASSLTDVLRNSPGITFGAGEGGNPLGDRPIIRGYDAQASTYVDGMRDIGATSREVFNLEQVEVVRGSDGAFGGRGGAGGSVNLISKTAKAEDFTAASLGIGTDSYYRGTIDSNWQLGEDGVPPERHVPRCRCGRPRHGQQQPLGRGAHDHVRPELADPRDLSYYHMQTDDLPDGGIPYAYPSTKVKRDGSYMGVSRTGPADVNRKNFYGLASDYRKTTSDMGTIGIEHDFSDRLTLRNMTRYTYSRRNTCGPSRTTARATC